MKRSIHNVTLKLSDHAFSKLKDVKSNLNALNLSETVEQLIAKHDVQSASLDIEDGIPQIEPVKPMFNDSFSVDDDIPIPVDPKPSAAPFSVIVENTLKKMAVGNSFLVKGEVQRTASLGVAKKLNMQVITRKTSSNPKDNNIRVWRVA